MLRDHERIKTLKITSIAARCIGLYLGPETLMGCSHSISPHSISPNLILPAPTVGVRIKNSAKWVYSVLRLMITVGSNVKIINPEAAVIVSFQLCDRMP